jgi:hypothetical protein
MWLQPVHDLMSGFDVMADKSILNSNTFLEHLMADGVWFDPINPSLSRRRLFII